MFTTPRYMRLIFIVLFFFMALNNQQSMDLTFSLFQTSGSLDYYAIFVEHQIAQFLLWVLFGSAVMWLFMPQRLE